MGVLQDQVAIITGAGSGIGAATTRRFIEEGASVVMVGWTRAKLEETARQINQPKRTVVVVGDVRDEKVAEEAVRAADEHFGRLDVVVSNAAVCQRTPFPETDLPQWLEDFNIVLVGAFRFARAASKYMIAKKIAGRIVNVTSIHGTQAEVGASNYGAAKAGTNQFTRCLAVELAPYGIRANAVAPGFVNTPMSVYDGRSELEAPRFLEEYVGRRRIPLARAGQPEEIAGTILFLASKDSSYVTGHVLVVDGGLTCTF